jgi:hypothetical protein
VSQVVTWLDLTGPTRRSCAETSRPKDEQRDLVFFPWVVQLLSSFFFGYMSAAFISFFATSPNAFKVHSNIALIS